MIPASQNVVRGVNPGILSIFVVVMIATGVAVQYSNIITFIGGLAIFQAFRLYLMPLKI